MRDRPRGFALDVFLMSMCRATGPPERLRRAEVERACVSVYQCIRIRSFENRVAHLSKPSAADEVQQESQETSGSGRFEIELRQ